MFQKKTIISIILILLLTAGVAGASYYIAQKTPQTPEPPPDSTTDWKVYRNEEYGYEIKYAPELTVQHPYGKQDVRLMKDSDIYYSLMVWALTGFIFRHGESVPVRTLSLKDQLIINLRQRCKWSSLETVAWRAVLIGGIEGLQASASDDQCINQYLPWSSVIKNNLRYNLILIKGSIDEYNQILSNFSFIE